MKKLNTAQLRIVLNMLENKAQELTNRAVTATKLRRDEGSKLLRRYAIEEIEKHGAKAISVGESSWYAQVPNIELTKAVQDRVLTRVRQELNVKYPLGETEEHMKQVRFVSMKNVCFHVPKSYVKDFENVDRKLTKAILDGSAFEVSDLILSIGTGPITKI